MIIDSLKWKKVWKSEIFFSLFEWLILSTNRIEEKKEYLFIILKNRKRNLDQNLSKSYTSENFIKKYIQINFLERFYILIEIKTKKIVGHFSRILSSKSRPVSGIDINFIKFVLKRSKWKNYLKKKRERKFFYQMEW